MCIADKKSITHGSDVSYSVGLESVEICDIDDPCSLIVSDGNGALLKCGKTHLYNAQFFEMRIGLDDVNGVSGESCHG